MNLMETMDKMEKEHSLLLTTSNGVFILDCYSVFQYTAFRAFLTVLYLTQPLLNQNSIVLISENKNELNITKYFFNK